MNQISGAAPVGVVGRGGIEGTQSGADLKDDFLRLLVAQMRYQDPLNPLSGADFTAQLAQFSSLEQLQNISGKLNESVEADMLLARSINNTMAATLIGKSVRAIDNQIAYEGKGTAVVNYDLSDRADTLTVEILNQDGVVIRTLTERALDSGAGSLVWDGKDSGGSYAPEGTYHVRISAVAPGGGPVGVQPLAIGRVDGVRFIDGNPVLLVDGREIAFGAVLEILEGETGNGNGSAGWFDELMTEGN